MRERSKPPSTNREKNTIRWCIITMISRRVSMMMSSSTTTTTTSVDVIPGSTWNLDVIYGVYGRMDRGRNEEEGRKRLNGYSDSKKKTKT